MAPWNWPNMDPVWLRAAAFAVGLIFFGLAERARPYRAPGFSRPRRWAVNLGLAAINNILLALALGGAVAAVALHTMAEGLGLFNAIGLPLWANILATVVFFDFMLYVWHLLNHKVPLLWRFHRVHHTDRDMDVSTATRFHAGELAVSLVIRLGLVYVCGAALWGVAAFESLVILCSQFHHSSLRVNPGFEALWWLLFVPPSMHRIHHSVKIAQRDTNYATIFSLWDRLCGTMLADVDQASIRIGVGGHWNPSGLGLGRILLMPFGPYVR